MFAVWLGRSGATPRYRRLRRFRSQVPLPPSWWLQLRRSSTNGGGQPNFSHNRGLALWDRCIKVLFFFQAGAGGQDNHRKRERRMPQPRVQHTARDRHACASTPTARAQTPWATRSTRHLTRRRATKQTTSLLWQAWPSAGPANFAPTQTQDAHEATLLGDPSGLVKHPTRRRASPRVRISASNCASQPCKPTTMSTLFYAKKGGVAQPTYTRIRAALQDPQARHHRG